MQHAALVLGGGGVTGEAFHRGVLRALRDELGYDAREAPLIVGTSAGSLVAAGLRPPYATPERDVDGSPDASLAGGRGAAGRAMDAGATLADWHPAAVSPTRRPWRLRKGVIASRLVPPTGHSTDFLADPLRKRFASGWPQGLRVVAVDRSSGQRVVFGAPLAPEVDVGSAVAASCAIPGYFTPVRIGGASYVDGGVHSPTNADVVRDCGASMVVISSPMSVDLAGAHPRWDLGLRLMWHRSLVAECQRLRRAGMTVLAFEPGREILERLGANLLDARRIDEVEELAYDTAVRRLERQRQVQAA